MKIFTEKRWHETVERKIYNLVIRAQKAESRCAYLENEWKKSIRHKRDAKGIFVK